MRMRFVAPLVVILSTVAGGQTSLPPDIHPESLSRLPPVQRADLDDEGKRIWDGLAGTGTSIPRTGPSAVTMHSPRAAEPIYALNQVLRKTVAGSKYFELAALVAAREFDQQYRVVVARASRVESGPRSVRHRRRQVQSGHSCRHAGEGSSRHSPVTGDLP